MIQFKKIYKAIKAVGSSNGLNPGTHDMRAAQAEVVKARSLH